MEIIISYDIISLGLLLKLVYKPDSKSGAPKAYRFKSDRGHHKDYFTPSKSLEFFNIKFYNIKRQYDKMKKYLNQFKFTGKQHYSTQLKSLFIRIDNV